MSQKNQYASLNNRELAAFSNQIAMLLKSGISVREGLDIIAEDLENENGIKLLTEIAATMELGNSFSKSLEQTNVFPKYMVDMVRVGEMTGHLEEVMKSLSLHFTRENELKQNIRNALRYPMIMVGMMVLVLVVIIVKVLPVFQQVFLQLGVSMSGISKGLLGVGIWMSRYAAILIGIIAILAIIGFWMSSFPTGQKVRKKIFSHFPGTKRIARMIQQARMTSTLSLAVSSGIRHKEALEMIQNMTESEEIRKKIQYGITLLDEGESTQNVFTKTELFHGMEARMVAIGFQTGNADEVLRQLSSQMMDEADEEMARMISRIEPTLVAFFSIIVGVILLSVMLPLMAVMSTIG